MKKTLIILALAGITFLNLSPAFAEDGPGAAGKLKRGVVNIITAPLEIPKQTRVYWKTGAQKTDHILVWILSGFVKGNVNMVARLGSGVWDIASSPWHASKAQPALFKPDYVFDGCEDLF